MPVPGGHVSVAIERSVTPTAITMVATGSAGSQITVGKDDRQQLCWGHLLGSYGALVGREHHAERRHDDRA
jgi:hypothetical protein